MERGPRRTPLLVHGARTIGFFFSPRDCMFDLEFTMAVGRPDVHSFGFPGQLPVTSIIIWQRRCDPLCGVCLVPT